MEKMTLEQIKVNSFTTSLKEEETAGRVCLTGWELCNTQFVCTVIRNCSNI